MPEYAPPRITEAHIRAALRLPSFEGRAAQRRMEPERRGAPPPEIDGAPPREASALAYLFRDEHGWRLPLTVRREDLPEHQGQVSLPGGRPAAGESLWDTALREAREEVALDVPALERLARLAPVYIPVTHTRLHVCVALGPDPTPLVACPREVERLVVVSLDELVDPERCRETTRVIQGVETRVPYFDVAGLFLWGATAMGLSELVERLRAFP